MKTSHILVIFLVATSMFLVGSADAQIVDFCGSNATVVLNGAPGPVVALAACPAGDAPPPAVFGWWIEITVVSNSVPIQNIPAEDFWLFDCDGGSNLFLCGGQQSINADSTTNAAGQTTISEVALAAGGCVTGMSVVVQGVVLPDPANCGVALCLPIEMKSFDMTADGAVTPADLSTFAGQYPPNPGHACSNFTGVGPVTTLADLSTFAIHFGPPGHLCL